MLSSEDFDRQLEVLSRDIVAAHSHWHMAMSLSEAFLKYPRVLSESNTFWYLTRKAHISTAIHSLCRVYDQEPNSLSLRDWLRTIKENISIFDRDAFRERLRDNPYVESLADSAEKPDVATLDQEIISCSKDNRVVHKLIILRASYYGHLGKKLGTKSKILNDELILKNEDVMQLLDRSISILNRYSYMFKATIHSTRMHDFDDYKFIFEAVDEKACEMQSIVDEE